jgi:UDP-N-acetylglucosamine diphosphorylase / glucose-1-phosphate thymidylyltransferase / UDP-N-acetylgalactosamine diphosphorylase / glucosamine-1-phosphate N-acetyltransferase / galactosamine-1-phosphate N-acetyltransferase
VKGVILAAGKGTRMLPLTERRPKPLVPVLDRPMLEHIILGVRDAGVTDLLLIVAYLGEMIQAHFGDGSRFGVNISYCWQEGPAGTGAATLLAEEFVGDEPFFLCWGDIIVGPETYRNVTRVWREELPRAVLSVNWVEDPWEGAAVYVREGLVERIVEKPPRGTAQTHYNNAGIFVFGSEIFGILRELPLSPRGEIEMPDAVQRLMASGAAIGAVEVEGYWSDVARPGSVLSLNEAIIRHRTPGGLIVDEAASVSPAAALTAPVYIGPGCRTGAAAVGPNAVLVSDVTVADGALLREAMCLGRNAIGAGCAVRSAILEEDVGLPPGLQVCGPEQMPAVLRVP